MVMNLDTLFKKRLDNPHGLNKSLIKFKDN